jgi:3-deoxy-D-manno-octulosonate 8-phosphate phosphatase (KDO 8-P phosphatase)
MIPAKVRAAARNVKLIAMDIDGVLTAGEVIVLNSGEEVKVWNVKDRFAFHLVKRAGLDIKFAWITGRESPQVKARADEIGIDVLYQSCMKKKEALQEIAGRFSLQPDEILYIGDDLVDIPVLRYVGLALCPKDAPAEVKQAADHATSVPGGRGVLREAVEIVLKSQGNWKKACAGYL